MQPLDQTETTIGLDLAAPPQSASQDADNQERFALFVKQQNKVLSLILSGTPLERVLFKVADISESIIEGAFCCIHTPDAENGDPVLVATRRLPPEYRDALERLQPDQADFPLTAASLEARPSFTADLLASIPDENPCPAHETAPVYDIRAAWAQPLIGEADKPYGAIGFFFRAARSPSRLEERLLEGLAGLACFAIEHTRSRQALDDADRRFAALADNIPGVVYQRTVSPEGEIRYSYISKAAEDLFGVSPDEIINNSTALFDTYGPDYRKNFSERLIQASREMTMWDVEATIIDREGQKKFTHAIARPSKRPDGYVVWDGVILDSTRIKEAEIAAAAAEARARSAILESLSEAVALYDERQQLLTCNALFLATFSGLEHVLKPGSSFEEFVRAEAEMLIHAGHDQTIVEIETDLRLNSGPADDWVGERRLENGGWVLLKQHHTEEGQIVLLCADVTEIKAREQALQRSNKELESFASVASHDLQEPLRKIEAFGDRLRRRSGEHLNDDGRQCIDRMQNAAGRMRKLINDLLSYSRVTTKARPFEATSIDTIVSEVVGDLSVSIEESGGEVHVDALPQIDADQLQMRQLFQNIIGNAIKYRKPDEAPRVSVSGRVLAKGEKRPAQLMSVGMMAEFVVQDNGIGFDMKYVDQIFTIFQRLHGRGDYEGTGIGLATVRKIVERHGGLIVAESEPDVGSTFTIYLPVTQTQEHQAA